MSLESKYMFINGKKVNFIFGGTGEPVILIRGWPRNCREDDKILIELSKHFQIFGLNLPGFGYSERLDKLTIESYINFIDTFSKRLKISSFKLIGFSYGGMLSLKYASAYPKNVKKLIVVAPPFYTKLLPFRVKTVKLISLFKKFKPVQNFISGVVNNDRLSTLFYKTITKYDNQNAEQKIDFEYTMEDLRKMNITDCTDIVESVMNLDLRDDCRKIEAQTLILIGKKDRMINERSGEMLYKIIKNSTLIKVDAEHWNIVETISEEGFISFLKD